MSRKILKIIFGSTALLLLAGLLAAGLSVPALAQSVPFPTYQVGPQTNGTFRRQRRHHHHPRAAPRSTSASGPRQGHRAQPLRQSHRGRPGHGYVGAQR